MELPDYKNSIVNLMSSISQALGDESRYSELSILRSDALSGKKNIILMVLDGLGYEYFKRNSSLLKGNLRGRMTSVFPPTTAAAITTFLTGVAPQQHAFTGWYVHLKEVGAVATILPFMARIGGGPFTTHGVKVREILTVGSLSERIKASCYVVQPNKILHSSFSAACTKHSQRSGYANFGGFLRQVKRIIRSHPRRKYIYAYWPEFDTICHKYGVASNKARKHFQEMEKGIAALAFSLRKTNTILIVTADHGLIDTPREKVLRLEDHPRLKDCLTLPFCGDARTIYCYVHPAKVKPFESYVKKKLSKFCWLYKSQELIDHDFYGLFPPNPKLIERIGDYVLIMKENYVFKDSLSGQKKRYHVGNHGGVSKEEMYVPLLVFSL